MARTLGLNHVSIGAADLEVSTRFYESFLGCARVPTPDFGYPVQWLQLGALQLHIFVRGEPAPRSPHFAVDVEDIAGAYAEAQRLGIVDGSPRRFPDGTIQIYVRDPAGNRVELDGCDDSLTAITTVPGPAGATLYSGRERP